VRRRAAGRRRGHGVRRRAADPVRGRHHRELAAHRGVLQQAQGAAAVPVHVRARPQAAALRQLAQRQERHGRVQGARAVVLITTSVSAAAARTYVTGGVPVSVAAWPTGQGQSVALVFSVSVRTYLDRACPCMRVPLWCCCTRSAACVYLPSSSDR
jgi:hypothetical protein